MPEKVTRVYGDDNPEGGRPFFVRFYEPGRPGEYDGYVVGMPHQCDEWEITPAYDAAPGPEAIAALEAFLADGQRALEALRAHVTATRP